MHTKVIKHKRNDYITRKTNQKQNTQKDRTEKDGRLAEGYFLQWKDTA